MNEKTMRATEANQALRDVWSALITAGMPPPPGSAKDWVSKDIFRVAAMSMVKKFPTPEVLSADRRARQLILSVVLENKGLTRNGITNLLYYRAKSRLVDMEDLHQECLLAIAHAIEKFDPDGGFSFSTYAVIWIKNMVSKYIDNHGGTIHIPSRVAIKNRSSNTDLPVKTQTFLEQCIYSDTGEHADYAVCKYRNEGVVDALISRLDKREQLVIRGRLNEETLASIGKTIGVTREFVRRIEFVAIEKMRKIAKREGMGVDL